MKIGIKIASLALFATLAACAPSVQGYDPQLDARLSCSEIEYELQKTRSARSEAQDNRGVSGQNVAWALFFWPGIIGNEISNADAIQAADDRIFYLSNLYDEKNCG